MLPAKTPQALWYPTSRSVGMALLQGALAPLSGAWWLGSTVHQAAYRWGFKKVYSTHATRVVAVGNVVVGGAGKTPLTLALMELCVARGIAAAVVSRGYGVHIDPPGLRVGPDTPAAQCGDEPLMLARAVPQVAVYAGRDRARLIALAATQGAAVVILDDGMQHHAVQPHALLAVVRTPFPFGNGRLLPAGPLRESPRALSRAHRVVVLGRDGREETRALLLAHGVEPGRILFSALEPVGLVALDDGPRVDLEWLRGKVVVAAAGMAQPARLEKELTQLGAVVKALIPWEDHASLDGRHVTQLQDSVAQHGAEAALVTQKDAVKWPGPSLRGARLLALKVAVGWDDGATRETVVQCLLGEPPCNR